MKDNELKSIIIHELGISGLPEEAQDEIAGRIGEIVLQTLTTTLLESFSNSVREEFEKISVTGDDISVKEFLDKNVPEIGTITKKVVKETIQSFKEQKKQISKL